MAPAFNDTQDVEATSPLLPSHSPSSHQSKQSSRARTGALVVAALVATLGVGWWTSCANTASKGEKPETKHWPTNIGFPGPTPTGIEAFAVETAYPSNRDSYPIRPPPPPSGSSHSFNILHNLGNLSPWRSVSHIQGTEGGDAEAQLPEGCELDSVSLLHRHGSRYPTSGAGPAKFGKKLQEARGEWEAKGELDFLNEWEYGLGAEILTPFGRKQLFDLGVGFRTKYGRLLPSPSGSTSPKKLVFRTESQDRMLKSALNFAAGFFGIPFEEQYHQLITIEAPGFNNTLAPSNTCTNDYRKSLSVSERKVQEWREVYLRRVTERLNEQIEGLELTVKDTFQMQELCAYELVALDGSAFCSLFNEEEWLGFEYALDLAFWYGSSYGHPAQAAVGLGWVSEWIARVTQTPITVFNSTTNSTWHTPRYFPLDQKIYVDATHDTIISAVITTLNLTQFSSSGPLPSTHIPDNRSFDLSKISPFASNLQSQILSCGPRKERKVRWILNDGLVPLDGVRGCEGTTACDLDVFVEEVKRMTSKIDWSYDCLAPYELGDEPILDGRPNGKRVPW